MARRTWQVELEDGQHTVELKHGTFSGKKQIFLDGRLVHEARQLVDFGGEFEFPVSGHFLTVKIETNGITFSYRLLVEGTPVETWRPSSNGEHPRAPSNARAKTVPRIEHTSVSEPMANEHRTILQSQANDFVKRLALGIAGSIFGAVAGIAIAILLFPDVPVSVRSILVVSAIFAPLGMVVRSWNSQPALRNDLRAGTIIRTTGPLSFGDFWRGSKLMLVDSLLDGRLARIAIDTTTGMPHLETGTVVHARDSGVIFEAYDAYGRLAYRHTGLEPPELLRRAA